MFSFDNLLVFVFPFQIFQVWDEKVPLFAVENEESIVFTKCLNSLAKLAFRRSGCFNNLINCSYLTRSPNESNGQIKVNLGRWQHALERRGMKVSA